MCVCAHMHHEKLQLMDMHFQLYELHVQQAIRETILHVRASKCMSMRELHVQHAVCLLAGDGMHFGKQYTCWQGMIFLDMHIRK